MNTKYLFKGLYLACLTLGLASCQNDEIESAAVSTTDSSSITLNCVIGNTVESRAMIQLGNQDESAEYCIWNEGDVLWVKNLGSDGTDTDGATYKFEISSDYSDDNPSSSASFVCSDTSASISDGDILSALYLGSSATEYTTTLSLEQNYRYTFEDYTDEEIEDYFKDSMYMGAKSTYSSNGTTLSLEHLTTLIRISYVNATDSNQDIAYLELSGNEYWYGHVAIYDEAEGSSYLYSSVGSFRNIFDDLTVGSNDAIDFYFLFFPNTDEFSAINTFTINVNGEELEFKTSDMETETFKAGYRYWFDIKKTDDGLQWTNYVMTESDKYVDYGGYIVILSETNAALCEFLASQMSGTYLDDEGNVWIPKEVVEATTKIEISGEDYGVQCLDGLECFTNLESLTVEDTSITNLEPSSFPNLYYLNCSENSLTSLDLSNNSKLVSLDCSGNSLRSLDLSNNPELVRLYCFGNSLTSLDLSNNPELISLQCHLNGLTSLDLSNNTLLSELICHMNDLTSLNLSNNTNLYYLECSGNNLTSINLSNKPFLQEVQCWSNKFTSLDLSNDTSLRYLYVHANELTNIDLSNCTSLQYFQCDFNKLTTLDLSNSTSLISLECNFNKLTTLDLSNNTFLQELSCYDNELINLDLSKNTALFSLNCGNNDLRSLDLSNNTDLRWLYCDKNENLNEILCSCAKLGGLDIDGDTALTTLKVDGNCLSALDICDLSNLTELTCGNQTNYSSGEAQTLTLTLSESQSTLWYGNWEYFSENYNVELSVVEDPTED